MLFLLLIKLNILDDCYIDYLRKTSSSLKSLSEDLVEIKDNNNIQRYPSEDLRTARVFADKLKKELQKLQELC